MPLHPDNPLQPFLDQLQDQYPELLALFQRILNPSDAGKALAVGLPSVLKPPPIPGFGPAASLGQTVASVGGGLFGAGGLLLPLPGESAGQTAQANAAPPLGPTNEYGPFAPGGALSGITDLLRNSGVPSLGGGAAALANVNKGAKRRRSTSRPRRRRQFGPVSRTTPRRSTIL